VQYWSKKVVLITGATAGLGYTIAQTFAAAGATVVINGRNQQTLDNAVEALSQHAANGGSVAGFAGDVTCDASVEDLFNSVQQKFGRLDALVNNVGVSTRGKAIDVTPGEHLDLFAKNVLSAVRCTRAAMPMLRVSKGHIVCIGSLASKSASRFLGGYPVSKFALAAYCQQLRLESREEGVHVLLVCPGPIARNDAGNRYNEQSGGLPDAAAKPGAGVKLKGIPPQKVAQRLLRGCEKRSPEIVLPGRARLLFAVAALFPKWGDWILTKMTSQ